MCDLVRPIKYLFPEYLAAEQKLSECIYQKSLDRQPTADEQANVKLVDDMMVAIETPQLITGDTSDWNFPVKADPKFPVECLCEPPNLIERTFLVLWSAIMTEKEKQEKGTIT